VSKCDLCKHKETCKYVEEFEAYQQKYLSSDKMFSVDVKCAQYWPYGLPQLYSVQHGILYK